MNAREQLVWAAAGSPARDALVPGPRTEARAQVRDKLEQRFGKLGGLHRVKQLVAGDGGKAAVPVAAAVVTAAPPGRRGRERGEAEVVRRGIVKAIL